MGTYERYVGGVWEPSTPATVLVLGLDALFDHWESAGIPLDTVTVHTRNAKSTFTYRRKDA